jgi:hypothetical protein
MTNLAGEFLSALSPGIAGSALIAMIPLCTVAAAEECVTRPKDETPPGKHWYYRIEGGTKRQCWYLREQSETAPQAATSRPVRVTPPDGTPERESELARSAADAHAELPTSPQRLVETQPKPARTAPITSVSLRGPEQSLPNNASPETVDWAVAYRRPDLTGAFFPADRPTSSPLVIASAAPDASLDVSAEPYSTSEVPPVAPTKVKAAASIPTAWLQVLLLGTFGAVATSWLLGGSLTARRRRRRRRPILSSPAWPKEEPTNRMSLPPQPGRLDSDVMAGSPSSGCERSIVSDDSREIVELLARFANQEEQAERA